MTELFFSFQISPFVSLPRCWIMAFGFNLLVFFCLPLYSHQPWTKQKLRPLPYFLPDSNNFGRIFNILHVWTKKNIYGVLRTIIAYPWHWNATDEGAIAMVIFPKKMSKFNSLWMSEESGRVSDTPSYHVVAADFWYFHFFQVVAILFTLSFSPVCMVPLWLWGDT